MRFWIALVVISCVNLVGWMVDWRSVLNREPSLQVAPANFAYDGVVPVGRVQTGSGLMVGEPGGTELRLRFDRAMDTAGPLPAAAFAPALAGSWRWDADRTLVFTAAAPLAPATRYTCTFSRDAVRAQDGTRLPAAVAMRFHTPALTLLGCRAVDLGDDGSQVLEFRFNHPVVADALVRAVQLKHPDGSAIPLKVEGDTQADTVRLRTAPLPRQVKLEVGVHLPKGFASPVGPLGLESDLNQPITLWDEVRCTQAEFVTGHSHQPVLRLEFNRALRSDVVTAAVKTDPPIALTLGRVEGGSGSADGSCFEFHGEFKAGIRYGVVIAPVTGADGARQPKRETLAAIAPDLNPQVWFVHDGGHLGSQGNRSIAAKVQNLAKVRLRIHRLYDSNLVAWRTGQRDVPRLGQPLVDRFLAVPGTVNTVHDLVLRLDDLLPIGAAADGVYQLDLDAERRDALVPLHQYAYLSSSTRVVSLSDLALSARLGKDEAIAWVTSLATGAPQRRVKVRLFSGKQQELGGRGPASALIERWSGTTGDDGLVRFGDLRLDATDTPAVLIASRMPESMADDEHARNHGLTWLDLHQSGLRDPLADTGGRPWNVHEAFVHPDRGLIRPGETVHLRAIVRAADGAVPPAFPVRWTAYRPDGRVYTTYDRKLDADGCAGWDPALPDTAMTGRWRFTIGIPGGLELGSDAIQVEDFIPERLRVALHLPGSAYAKERTDAVAEPRLAAGALTFTVQGDWLFGAAGEGLQSSLALRVDPLYFHHADWNEWWTADAADVVKEVGLSSSASGDRLADPLGQKLDAKGSAQYQVDLAQRLQRDVTTARPWRLSATAGVSEAGGRTVSASRSAIIDPVPHYLVVKPGPASAGAVCTVDLRLIKPDGILATAEAAAEVRCWRSRWETTVTHENGAYRYTSARVLEPVGGSIPVRLVAGSGQVQIAIPAGGSFVVLAHIPGSKLAVSGQLFAQAPGSDWQDSIARERPEHAEVALASGTETVGKQAFARVGSPIALDLRSPFAGTLLITVEGERVHQTRVQTLTAPATRIELVPDATWGGTAYVTATIVRAVQPDQPWRVHRAFGVCPVRIRQSDRAATVALNLPAEVRPGAEFACAALVADASGKPLADAAVTIAAVDEGILRPCAFRAPDPFAFFTAKRSHAVSAYDAYADLLPEVPRAGTATIGGDGDLAEGMDRHSAPVSVRRVVPVALWSGVVRSGADGLARATFTVPESFAGSLRVMVVAVHGARSGAAAQPLPVRSPVLVQASLPRFLAPSDRCHVPVTVFNQGEAGTAIVESSIDGVGTISPARQEISIAARGSAVVWVDLDAGSAPGRLGFSVTASIGNERHRERTDLPVRPAAGVVTVGGAELVEPGRPLTLNPATRFLAGGFHEADLRVDPLPALGIPQGIDRLVRYPYGCAEQTISTCLGLISAPAFLPASWQDGGRAAVAERLASGFARLEGMATHDGGLGMWPGERMAWPWASVLGAHLCHETKVAGFPVPEHLREHLLRYCRNLLRRTDADLLATRCYAAHILALHGEPQPAVLDRLALEAKAQKNPPPECTLHLALAWQAIGNRARAATLLPTTFGVRAGRADGGDCGSPVRDRALAVLALLAIDQQRPDQHRLARELDQPDQWLNTQDLVWAVLALGRYRAAIVPVPFTSVGLTGADGNILGSGTATGLRWHGATLPAGAQVRVDGPTGARGYLAWTASGIPLEPPKPCTEGLSIARQWSKRPDRIRSGELVEIRLEIRSVGGLARRNLVVEDLLPAGCEIENPRLGTSAAQSAQEDQPTEAEEQPEAVESEDVFKPAPPPVTVKRLSAWAESSARRVEIRDDRIVIMGDLPAGNHALIHTYLVRAVGIGRFVLPPATAESMYDRTVRAVSASGTVEITAR